MSSSVVSPNVAALPKVLEAELRAKLLDVKAVAQLLGCSARHVYRLSDGGKMPAPVRLGALVRWRLDGPGGLRMWIAEGCPAVRKGAPR